MYTHTHPLNIYYVLLYIYRFHHIFDSRPNASHFLECLPLRYMGTVVVSYYINKPFSKSDVKWWNNIAAGNEGKSSSSFIFFPHTLDAIGTDFKRTIIPTIIPMYVLLKRFFMTFLWNTHVLHFIEKKNTFDVFSVCMLCKTR